MSSGLNYIDLFAGAGGLSEGFIRAGFNPVAHVELDANACKTLKTRTAYHWLKSKGQQEVYNQYINGLLTIEELYEKVPERLLNAVLNYEISDTTIGEVFDNIDVLKGEEQVDVIVGGPPCQVYSLVGRSRIGQDNVQADKRYNLYKFYGQFLRRYKPKYFVFENVQGLLSADGGKLLSDIEKFLEDCGYRVKYKLLNAADFGVLQKRKRVILIGKRGLKDFEYPSFDIQPVNWTVKTALFSDLKSIRAGEGKLLQAYKGKDVNDYLKQHHLRNGEASVTHHIARPHLERDLEIYSIAVNKWLNDKERLKYNDLPKKLKTHQNETAFLDRFKVVDPDGFSHTVVAHISKDGHYFIYPDAVNPRSISVREAARLQSFPDDYFFEGGRTAAFKQIGNAVPPLMALNIANSIKGFL